MDANYLLYTMQGSSRNVIYNIVKEDGLLDIFPLPFQTCTHLNPNYAPVFSPFPTEIFIPERPPLFL